MDVYDWGVSSLKTTLIVNIYIYIYLNVYINKINIIQTDQAAHCTILGARIKSLSSPIKSTLPPDGN